MSKKILLIGKTGQIGGAILANAADLGFEVISPTHEELDIRNYENLKSFIFATRPDILINTAALHAVPKCEGKFTEVMDANFSTVAYMANFSKELDIPFVNFSTDYVFDGELGRPYNEDDKPNPLQIYGISKLAGEHAALAMYPKGSFVVRIAAVFGGGKIGSRQKGGNFVLNILKEAAEKDIMEVSSEQIVSPTYADDLSVATLKLLDCGAPSGIYHLVNEGQTSWCEFAKEIVKLGGFKTNILPVDRGGVFGDVRKPKFTVLKNNKAKALGIELPHWRDGLERYMASISQVN